MLRLMHSFSEHMHKPPVKFPISPFHFSSIFPNTPNSKNSCAPLSVNWNFRPDPCPKPVFWNFYHDHHLDSLPDADAEAEDRSLCNVKLLCSFGGKLIPRDDDGNLHYVGGLKRINTVRRDTTFQEEKIATRDLVSTDEERVLDGPLRRKQHRNANRHKHKAFPLQKRRRIKKAETTLAPIPEEDIYDPCMRETSTISPITKDESEFATDPTLARDSR